MLADNHLIQLATTCGSASAGRTHSALRPGYVFESHHKTQPSADAVLLMADSCVLGPNRHCHVRCRDWEHDVVVYRQNDRVFCRADEPLSIDGVVQNGASEIQSGMRVEGEEFSFTWETVVGVGQAFSLTCLHELCQAGKPDLQAANWTDGQSHSYARTRAAFCA